MANIIRVMGNGGSFLEEGAFVVVDFRFRKNVLNFAKNFEVGVGDSGIGGLVLGTELEFNGEFLKW